MILTCENCLKRYLVSDRAVGDAGRQVRCVACGHEWFQEPPKPEEGAAAPDIMDLEPIPESVKPLPEGSNVPAVIKEKKVKAGAAGGRGAGYIAALAVFFIILAGLLVARESLSAAWPPVNAFYQAIGLPASLPADGLSLDDVQATVAPNAQGVDVLTIHGHIVNHRSSAVKLPPLAAELRLEDGKLFDHWRVELTQRLMGPHQTLPFVTSYPAAPKNAKAAAVKFLLR